MKQNVDHHGYIEWIEKFDFGNLPVEDRRTMKNEQRTSKNGWKSSWNHPRKRYGSASAWIFFMETIFFTNFKWFSNYQEGWTFFPFTSPPIYRKIGEKLATQLAQASSARPGELGCFLQKQPPSGGSFWKAQVGLVASCTSIFTKYTPCLFWWFFFRNVTKLYEFRNDTYFLSVRLRNLTDHVFTLF